MIIHIRLIFFGLVIIAFSQFSTVGVFVASAAELTREQVIDLMISITELEKQVIANPDWLAP